MKNFSNYNDYSTKEELHFESKAVHGALGTEPLTGAVSMPIFQTATFRHPALGESTGFAYSRLENPTRQELERTMAILTISYGSSMVAVTGMASMSRNFVPTMGCFFEIGRASCRERV